MLENASGSVSSYAFCWLAVQCTQPEFTYKNKRGLLFYSCEHVRTGTKNIPHRNQVKNMKKCLNF